MPYSDLDVEEKKSKAVWTIVLVLLAGAAIFLSSCTMGYATDGVKKTYVGAVGGRGAGKSALLAMNWDNEKSFNDLAWVALAAIPAIQAVKSIEATEATAQTVNNNATKVSTQQIKSNEVITTGAQKASVEIAKIPKP